MALNRLGFSFLGFAGLLLGCNPILDSVGSAQPQPATEATVIGTWRDAEPTLDNHFLRTTLRVDSNHTLLWSRRYSANPSVVDTEFFHEDWSWSVAAGSLIGVKKACRYAEAPDYALTEAPCYPPHG